MPIWYLVPTLGIAAAVAIIGFLQWRMVRQRIIVDVYDKRFSLYSDIRKVVAKVIETRKVEESEHRALKDLVESSYFLFDETIWAEMESVAGIFVQLFEVTLELSDEPKPDMAEALRDRRSRLRSELMEEYHSLPELFRPYMRMPTKLYDFRDRWEQLKHLSQGAFYWTAPRARSLWLRLQEGARRILKSRSG